MAGTDEECVMVEVVPATAATWPAVDAVMGPSGGDARCWCQYFHQGGRVWESRGRGNRALLEQQVRDGPPPGLVAMVDGDPVGWVALARRSSYQRIGRSPIMRPDPDRDFPLDDDGVWAITCFVVPREHRGTGLMRTLLDAAIDHARANGAHAVEAYPVDTRGEPADSANLYYGVLSVFEAAGFTTVDHPRPHRARVRLDLGAA